MRVVAALVAVLLTGCTLPWDDVEPIVPTPRPTTSDGFRAPELTFAGVVRDALDEGPVEGAILRVSVAEERPCERPGLGWASYELPLDAQGRFGPRNLTTPAGEGWRFFIEAEAAGYTKELVFIGPRQANSTANITIVLHPRANVTGTAPPGTVLALQRDGAFPTLTAADASGRFAFEGVHLGSRQLVAATGIPQRVVVSAPQVVDVEENGTGWVLRGTVKRSDGAVIAADVVAWNGSRLVSAARTNDLGNFAMPLTPEPADLRIEARTPGNAYGGVLALDLNGPPARVETLLVRARC